ncbi:MAG: ABC transporter ATP-binding protein, partial [Calditrichaceae bacterium]
MSANEHPIIIKNLKKSYGSVQALKDVSLDVAKGEIFGLIGPDGAGKTTLIRILVSLLNPDSGDVLFHGKPVQEDLRNVRANIGYMPQRFSLYPDLTVEQNLRFFGDLFRIPKSAQLEQMSRLYDFSRLGPFKKRRAGDLSGGMKQKLALSCMLMHEPDVVVMDEPTFGVDPVSRNEFWEILQTLAKEGTCILVSTAYMDEAGLCDRVGLMYDGELLATDRPESLIQSFKSDLFLIRTDKPYSVFEALQSTSWKEKVQLFGNGVHFLDKEKIGHDEICSGLNKIKIAYHAVDLIQPTLENLFLELMT